MPGSASAALISLLSFSMISLGVPFGTLMPKNALASYPGTLSATVGTSGKAGERCAVVTPSGRSLPAWMCGSDDGMLSNMTCTVPLIMSVSAGAEPRYGTWLSSTPVLILNSSPDKCTDVSFPDDAQLILPGLALA